MREVTHRMIGSTWLVLFLCACVLAQMLGMPITFFSLVASSDAFTESVSEDFSFPQQCRNQERQAHGVPTLSDNRCHIFVSL